MVTWTTESIVKARLNQRTPLATVDINEFIEQAEQFFLVHMKAYGKFGIGGGTFDATKHGALRDAATAMAALKCIAATSLSWQTLEQAELAADVYYQQIIFYMNLLSDQDYVTYLSRL